MHEAKVVEELEAMRLPELQVRYAEVVGKQTRSPNKKWLVKEIAEGLRSIEALEQRQAAEAETADAATERVTTATETPPAETPAEPAPKRKSRKKVDPGDTPGTEGEPKLSKLPLEDLQATYRQVIGRDTKSTSRGYLLWKIGQARNGKLPIGPRAGRGGTCAPMKVLPMRVPAAAIEPLDEARRRLNLRSRNDLFLRAVHAYLEAAGEKEVAGHFATADITAE